MQFAKKFLLEQPNWDNVLWSDEKWFTLNGPDFYSSYWRHISDPINERKRSQKGGNGIMMWGMFSSNGKRAFKFSNRTLNSEGYIRILKEKLLPVLENNINTMIIQQDNASIHNSGITKDFIRDNDVIQMDWPALSPYLNPIENLWGILCNKVYGGNKQYESKSQLEDSIQSEWEIIPIETLHNLALSLPSRLISVIENNGGVTKY